MPQILDHPGKRLAEVLQVLRELRKQCVNILEDNCDGAYCGERRPDQIMEDLFDDAVERVKETFEDVVSDTEDTDNTSAGWAQFDSRMTSRI